MKAIHLAANAIALGQIDVAMAGGMENMSQVPHYLSGRQGVKLGNLKAVDGMVLDDVSVTVTAGNSGDLGSSFRVQGTHPSAAHDVEWISDPAPGDPNLTMSPK